MHFNILSWNSIEDAPFSPFPERSPDEIVAHERAGFVATSPSIIVKPLDSARHARCESMDLQPGYNRLTAMKYRPFCGTGSDKRMGHHRGMAAQRY
jgi:hypothetical protein